MIVLGLDTATSATVVGVLGADGVVHEVRDDPPPGARPAHAARLLGAVDEALAAAGVGWDDVTRLTVSVEPGSFTGLRIGIATARGLAQARGLEVVGVGSLAALARGADAESVLAVLDARRGEAFAAARGVASPTQLRSMMKDEGRDLLAEFRALAPDRPPIAIQRWSVRRVLLTVGVAMGLFLALVLVVNNWAVFT